MDKTMKVEVAYASKSKQFLKEVGVPVDASIRDAIVHSGVLEAFPELLLDELSVGVFSHKKVLSDILSHGDRVEIYRPLEMDPKEARRLRAKKKV